MSISLIIKMEKVVFHGYVPLLREKVGSKEIALSHHPANSKMDHLGVTNHHIHLADVSPAFSYADG